MQLVRCDFKAYYSVYSSQTLKIILAEVFKANLFQEILLPTFDAAVNTNWNITLLADYTAEASLLIASS